MTQSANARQDRTGTGIRISADLHQSLKIKAAEAKTNLRTIVEEAVTRYLAENGNGHGKKRSKAA